MNVSKSTSIEYRRPYRPRLIAGINAIGRTLGRIGFRASSLEEDSLINTVVRKTGLDDFGNESFLERMRLLIRSLENEARLHPFGRFMARQNMIRYLSNRLKIEDALKKHPEILNIKMEDPVFVVGLQRTGTTMMQRLLAADAECFRFLASWEAISPAPLSGEKPFKNKDPRVTMAVTAGRALRYMAPDFFAIHPVEPLDPEEDCLLFDYDFWSTVPEAIMRVPSFSRWLEERDHTEAYMYYKKILQYLYWQNPKGRWILKTPQHMEHFDELFRVFPGARIIQTHRDPARVVASFCSMVSHAYGIFSDRVDPVEIGRHWSRKAQIMVDRSMEIRKKISAGSFLDVHYADIMGDPVGVMRRVYGFLKIPFAAENEELVRRWVRENPQHKHGKHSYRLDDFGLSRTDIEKIFAAYRARFNIPEEKSNG